VDLGEDAMAHAADGHHSRALHRQHVVEQLSGQGEMAEMVGAELQLETVLGGLFRRVHHPGVVDQQVDGRVRRAQFIGGGADVVE
jgi:hypothetical protein